MWGEPDARIYFFGTYQEAEEGWIAWMEQAMTESEDGDDVPCVILEIKASAVHDLIAVQFEWQATNPVPITAVLNVIEL